MSTLFVIAVQSLIVLYGVIAFVRIMRKRAKPMDWPWTAMGIVCLAAINATVWNWHDGPIFQEGTPAMSFSQILRGLALVFLIHVTYQVTRGRL